MRCVTGAECQSLCRSGRSEYHNDQCLIAILEAPVAELPNSLTWKCAFSGCWLLTLIGFTFHEYGAMDAVS